MSTRVLITVILVSAAACARLGGAAALPGPAAVPVARDVLRFKTLWSFNQSDGCYPLGAQIEVGKKLYGTTSCGGRFGNGTVYELAANGKVHDVHDFEKDGSGPLGQVVAVGRTLYGTAYGGGKRGYGTVYSIDATTGKEIWFYSFKGAQDGANPNGGLLYVNGLLYGTTTAGGAATCSTGAGGCGTIFTVSASGKERTIYRFQGGNDGEAPTGTLADVDGTLYGTTTAGGGASSMGTVFVVTPSGAEQVLHSFTGSVTDGGYPTGNLIFAHGKLYGTTEWGGATNKGSAYNITTTGQFELLHSFGSKYGGDGWYPGAGLTALNGKFYGTTLRGGDYSCGGEDGCGVIYVLKVDGDEKELFSFQGGSGGSESNAPLFARKRALYGTTAEGGACQYGTIFSVVP